jgi:hypothetical protein
MDADRDAICELMEQGIYHDEKSREENARDESLWGKWCDPERVECPECRGFGENVVDERCSDDFSECTWVYEECQKCYGTGKIKPPTPPHPPTPPPSRYSIVNGGILAGVHRAVVLKDGTPYHERLSFSSFDDARKHAEAFVAAAEEDK